MEVERSSSVDGHWARRRMKELDREILALFRATPAGPELVRRWSDLICEAKVLESQLAAATLSPTVPNPSSFAPEGSERYTAHERASVKGMPE